MMNLFPWGLVSSQQTMLQTDVLPSRLCCSIYIVCESLSRARLFATPWTAVHQAPLSIRFSRQGYWSGLPFPSPVDLPNPGIEPGSPALQADDLPIIAPFWESSFSGGPMHIHVSRGPHPGPCILVFLTPGLTFLKEEEVEQTVYPQGELSHRKR